MILESELNLRAGNRINNQGRHIRTISDADISYLSREMGLPARNIYLKSMKMGIVPLRYVRNSPSITLSDQIILAESSVAVAGAGGLGGYIIEFLVRMGVGELHVFDPDCFDETNLNRQVFASKNTVGAPKARAVHDACRSINPGVMLSPHIMALNDTSQAPLLKGVRVIADALDSAEDRLTLSAISKVLGVPLVHGTVAGFEGRIMTVFPGDDSLDKLYGGEREKVSAEHLLGTPALSPALIASFQAMAILKLLLNRTGTGSSEMVYIDMNHPSMDIFSMGA